MKIRELTDTFFDRQMTDADKTSPSPNDLLCLKVALARFLKSGRKDDAFDVYFCFSEIYRVFGDGASVGIIKNSGGAVEKFLENRTPNVISLPADPTAIQNFLPR